MPCHWYVEFAKRSCRGRVLCAPRQSCALVSICRINPLLCGMCRHTCDQSSTMHRISDPHSDRHVSCQQCCLHDSQSAAPALLRCLPQLTFCTLYFSWPVAQCVAGHLRCGENAFVPDLCAFYALHLVWQLICILVDISPAPVAQPPAAHLHRGENARVPDLCVF